MLSLLLFSLVNFNNFIFAGNESFVSHKQEEKHPAQMWLDNTLPFSMYKNRGFYMEGFFGEGARMSC